MPLTALLRTLRERGRPIVDLTDSNPTSCDLVASRELLSEIFLPQHAQRYEPDPRGLREAREALVKLYDDVGIKLDPDQVLLTASTSEAYSFLFQLLCNPGESVLVPQPSYPLLDYLAELNNVALRPYRLVHAGEWMYDLGSVCEGLTEQTRAIILIHPNNPTGSYIKQHEREALLETAGSRGIPLIVDEVFWWFPLGAEGARPPSFASEQQTLTFTLNGLSKLLGLPQLKLGWITLSGPLPAQHEALKRLEIIADTYLSVGGPVQRALPELLKRRVELMEPILTRVRGNVDQLRLILGPTNEVTVLHPEGGWTAVLHLPALKSSEEWCLEFLERAGVLVHPGGLYGWETRSAAVVSLLVRPSALKEGLRKLIAVVRDTMLRHPADTSDRDH